MSISICVEKTQNIPPEENLGNSFFPEKKNDVSQSKNGRDTRPYTNIPDRKNISLVVLFLFYISKKTLCFPTIMGRHRKNSPRKSAGVVRAKCGQQGKLSSFAEAFQELRDGTVIEETKYQYKCKIEAMKRWLDENYEEKSRVLTPLEIC